VSKVNFKNELDNKLINFIETEWNLDPIYKLVCNLGHSSKMFVRNGMGNLLHSIKSYESKENKMYLE
jgi:hypothetical protein